DPPAALVLGAVVLAAELVRAERAGGPSDAVRGAVVDIGGSGATLAERERTVAGVQQRELLAQSRRRHVAGVRQRFGEIEHGPDGHGRVPHDLARLRRARRTCALLAPRPAGAIEVDVQHGRPRADQPVQQRRRQPGGSPAAPAAPHALPWTWLRSPSSGAVACTSPARRSLAPLEPLLPCSSTTRSRRTSWSASSNAGSASSPSATARSTARGRSSPTSASHPARPEERRG